MDKLKRLIILIVMLVIIAFAVAFIVWRAGFYPPGAARPEVGVESKAGAEPNKPGECQEPGAAEREEAVVDVNVPTDVNEPNEPSEPNEPFRPRRPFGRGRRFERGRPFEPMDANDPNAQLEALNLKDVQMKDIIQKLADWTGKVIIPSDEAMKQKITIYSAQKLPRSEAIWLIYSALRAKGFVAEQSDNAIYLKPIKEAKLGAVPTVPADYPLASIENKQEIVQKFFKLKNYSPTRMGEIILPLIGDYGYVSADENTGTLLVIDTVENLIRVNRIITQFDVPEAEQTVTKIFQIRYGDPAEIVQLLRMLLSDDGGRSAKGSSRSSKSSSQPRPGDKKKPRKGAVEAATSVVVTLSEAPVVLIPEPRRKWIIARASADDMKQIEQWIEKLDKKEPVESEYETIPITYADVSEVASRLNEALQQMPGTELKASVLVQPLQQARQIVIFGRADLREMVKKLIEEIDIPPGQFETQVFELKHADPEQIKANIEGLYEQQAGYSYSYGYRSYRRQRVAASDTVKVIAFPMMQEVTVIASPENMRKIEEQIARWDVPLDVEKVKPLIITLLNSDPVKMVELLTTLFSEEAAGRMSFWDIYFGRGEEKKKIVGPLYGQLTFEAVPGTKKIIVISKIPEAYKVIEELVEDLDRQEMAEVPKVITLNYADPEELAERLNAIFNEPGTIATIRLGERGLSATGMEETGDEESSGESSSEETEVYTPWWTKAQRKLDEMPISNVIGRIRFIPDRRSKAILVLAPPEFIDRIEEMIKELDKPGKQVRIKAVVVEVNHRDMTSLGLQLAAAKTTFGTLEENAITALTELTFLEEHGSLRLQVDTDVTALVDFLVKTINAKVLNQQTLWTKDNEEADFFKGQIVAFIKSATISTEGRQSTTNYEYPQVGMTLRVRPNITPQKNVDMNIDLTISQISLERVNEQPVRTHMNTTTTAIVQDGQTVMLGGILFQEDSTVERKIALLGDIPVVGGLFRHNETVESNNELIIFITPEVIDEEQMLSETAGAEEKLKSMLEELAPIEGNE